MLTTKQGFALLDITSRQTIYITLQHFNWGGKEHLTWNEFRLLLELQAFRGVKLGKGSVEQFLNLARTELDQLFKDHSIDIDDRLKKLKIQHSRRLIKTTKTSSLVTK